MTDTWQKATITKIINQTPDFKSFFLKPEKIVNFKSGNFVELAIDKNSPYKCYSVVSSPLEHKVIEIGVKLYKTGALSPLLFKLKVGDKILMRGPTGVYFIWEKSIRNTVMIAGGAGICPMISILRQFDPSKSKASLLFSAKKGSIYYKNELSKVCKRKSVNFDLIQTGKDLRVSKKMLIEKFGNVINENTDFFVAGPGGFVGNISYWLQEAGVKPENLKTDDFGSD